MLRARDSVASRDLIDDDGFDLALSVAHRERQFDPYRPGLQDFADLGEGLGAHLPAAGQDAPSVRRLGEHPPIRGGAQRNGIARVHPAHDDVLPELPGRVAGEVEFAQPFADFVVGGHPASQSIRRVR